MKIIIDADSCPGKHIIEEVAKKNNINVVMYCDVSHIINSDYSEVRVVDSGFQSVDIKVINDTEKGDIIVTQDYGLAAIVLSKNAYAISPKGYIYNNKNIDRLLFERHLSLKARKVGIKVGNPKKRIDKDDKRLYENLSKLIEEFCINK